MVQQKAFFPIKADLFQKITLKLFEEFEFLPKHLDKGMLGWQKIYWKEKAKIVLTMIMLYNGGMIVLAENGRGYSQTGRE